jgi:hypothetical protein
VSSGRASVFGGDEDLDVSGFEPKPVAPKPAARPEQVRAVSEEASFRSREPGAATPAALAPARREPRRYRTGRNVQLNLKVRQEAADAFYAIADSQGWVLGEAFEHAVEALRRKLPGS